MIWEDWIREVVIGEDGRGRASRESGFNGCLRECGVEALEEGEDEDCGEEVGNSHRGELEVGLPAGFCILMSELFLSGVA